MSTFHDDFVPVTGADLPPNRVRSDLDSLRGVVVDSDLDKHMLRLLALHPDLRTCLGGRDLAALDVNAKQALLDEMNAILGLHPASHSPR